jgi:hypothetical protein
MLTFRGVLATNLYKLPREIENCVWGYFQTFSCQDSRWDSALFAPQVYETIWITLDHLSLPTVYMAYPDPLLTTRKKLLVRVSDVLLEWSHNDDSIYHLCLGFIDAHSAHSAHERYLLFHRQKQISTYRITVYVAADLETLQLYAIQRFSLPGLWYYERVDRKSSCGEHLQFVEMARNRFDYGAWWQSIAEWATAKSGDETISNLAQLEKDTKICNDYGYMNGTSKIHLTQATRASLLTKLERVYWWQRVPENVNSKYFRTNAIFLLTDGTWYSIFHGCGYLDTTLAGVFIQSFFEFYKIKDLFVAYQAEMLMRCRRLQR